MQLDIAVWMFDKGPNIQEFHLFSLYDFIVLQHVEFVIIIMIW